mgnify:CR=1 FL=1
MAVKPKQMLRQKMEETIGAAAHTLGGVTLKNSQSHYVSFHYNTAWISIITNRLRKQIDSKIHFPTKTTSTSNPNNEGTH